jgi:hypothetical protein
VKVGYFFFDSDSNPEPTAKSDVCDCASSPPKKARRVGFSEVLSLQFRGYPLNYRVRPLAPSNSNVPLNFNMVACTGDNEAESNCKEHAYIFTREL